jgi:hypothetical protein
MEGKEPLHNGSHDKTILTLADPTHSGQPKGLFKARTKAMLFSLLQTATKVMTVIQAVETGARLRLPWTCREISSN